MVVAGCNAFHLALDPLLIFGAGWGVSGAAAATAAAEWAAAAAYLGVLWRRREQLGEHLALQYFGLQCTKVPRHPVAAAGAAQ